ncbi:hypothetical protein LJC45_04720 [Alistipes sp. OttesenSCG-928-B03]|nr:hypothetical protein [Alistipes sp. OttesenSCG-928-B03]
MGNICRHIVLFFAAAVLAAGCSTTRRLADGDVLYTGVKKMEVEMATGDDAPGEVESVVKEQLSVKPNNPLFSPYVRTPLPVGLWAWNSFYTERQTGFRAWLFRMFAKRPVLMSEVQPKARVELVQDILDNHGYFGSAADYEVIEQRNPRKARINYRVQIAEPWHYASIEYPQVRGRLTQRISELQATSKLRVGERYDTDSLSDERIRITNILREESYYYFRPEYMEYLADTTRQRLGIDLRMVMANGIPQAAMQPYDIGNVDIRIYNIAGTGEADSTVHRGMKIWYQLPQKVRPKILRRTLTIAPGRPARLSDLNKTLTNLTKLGIFRYVTMGVAPLDSLGGGQRQTRPDALDGDGQTARRRIRGRRYTQVEQFSGARCSVQHPPQKFLPRRRGAGREAQRRLRVADRQQVAGRRRLDQLL